MCSIVLAIHSNAPVDTRRTSCHSSKGMCCKNMDGTERCFYKSASDRRGALAQPSQQHANMAAFSLDLLDHYSLWHPFARRIALWSTLVFFLSLRHVLLIAHTLVITIQGYPCYVSILSSACAHYNVAHFIDCHTHLDWHYGATVSME